MALPDRAVSNSGPPAAGASFCPLQNLLAGRRTLVMGILNITPDSFSDGGRFVDPPIAIAHARGMAEDGADILDLGAESTRPYGGAEPVAYETEISRLEPVLAPVVALGVPVSVDTMKAKVADWAVRAGAAIINDVWGLQRDPDMARVAATHQVPVVVMHNRDAADPGIDIVADMMSFFARSLEIAKAAGIRRDRVVLDPGIGFGKTPEQSLISLARIDALKRFGLPLLVGASRKRFISSVAPSDPDHRLGGSIAAHLLAAQNGADIIRVHDVAETVQALRIAAAVRNAR
jgi:dihydropteroate synthase